MDGSPFSSKYIYSTWFSWFSYGSPGSPFYSDPMPPNMYVQVQYTTDETIYLTTS